jgi:hypothetical protein
VFDHTGATGGTITGVFRDPSAWYHCFVVNNGTTVTGYINGVQAFTWTVSILNFNNAGTHYIGRHNSGSSYFDGYMADVYFVDGQALTLSSFAGADINGVWTPKPYSGTYGINGFFLKFNDGSSAANAFLDRSGNSNNWTPSLNIHVTGSQCDWLKDTPTNNYACGNPLVTPNLTTTWNEGNLFATVATGTNAGTRVYGTAFPISGLYYMEAEFVTDAAAGEWSQFGVSSDGEDPFTGSVGGTPATEWVATDSANKRTNNTATAYGVAQASSFTLRMAVNMNTHKVWVGDASGWYSSGDPVAGTGEMYSGLPSTLFPMAGIYRSTTTSQTVRFNFGQRPFAYTPPTGYNNLCTANMPIVTVVNPRKHFDITVFQANGASKTVTNVGGFKPDLVLLKAKAMVSNWFMGDIVRGVDNIIYPNQTVEEAVVDLAVDSFNSDGFAGGGPIVATSGFFVSAYQWKANGTAVALNSGSLSATGSVNTTAGFSIVRWTGNATSNQTVQHGLGVVPKMIWVKNLDTNPTSWAIGHANLNNGVTPWNYWLQFDTPVESASTFVWSNTAPSSTVFTVGTASNTNEFGKRHIAYVFAEVAGYSKFGAYSGTGTADGRYVYCGFRPRFIILKAASSAQHWFFIDTVNNTVNVMNDYFNPNTSLSNATFASGGIDVTATGFKVRTNSTAINTGSARVVYAAFAENPFGGANVSPATAR